ncbi:MAG: hypothetical protein AAF823_00605 [Planctomycetota bacterium]
MPLKRTVASVQYDNAADGKPFFVDHLGFVVVHEDPTLCVVTRDTVTFMLETNADYAAQLAPLVRVEVDDIHTFWAELAAKPTHADFAHERFPDGPELRPWGAHEFAAHDQGACIVFQQWTQPTT